ncbi:MAG: UDP-N-acetylmuramoyl-tripeptide--D-alanyl-D-alanine ligase [Coriobacteriia bacterium]|nr:UDP-N-acetylmuramoyl-tripeptide--D-alanyl-D-alanine ligase [Coriobacteriia bacterium]MBS5477334.1 UDP-N-acetylmuramoyl-tripeptide--D-alanyl-D-alanine ligase [Coriobacteriia bacterium]
MVRVTVRQIVEATEARLVCGPETREVLGVAIDSREVGEGGLFVALPGERVDGNDYVCAAIEAGVGAVAMTRDPDTAMVAQASGAGVALLRIEDGERFLQDLAAWWRDQLDALVVGVTGSSGKTTTRTMVAAVLATRYKTHQNEANYNNLIGVPLTILSCPADAEALVVEMGMDHPGEIATLAAVARPRIGLITNVGVAHIGILGSRQAIAAAKAELVEALPPTDREAAVPSRVLLWGEDDFTGWIADEVAGPRGVDVVRYGTSQGDDARATNISMDEAGCASADFALPSGATCHVHLAIPGSHNVRNALVAAALGDGLGIPADAIAAALEGVAPLKMHQQVLQAPAGYTVIDDSYNANPDSMRLALDVLCTLPGNRRVACVGDMGELGEREGLLHAVIGAYAAAKPIDDLVCVGALSHETAEAARLMGMDPAHVFEVADAAAAVPVLAGLLAPGDVALVKASRSTGLDAVVAGVMR